MGKTVYQNEILPQNVLPNAVRKIVGSQKVTSEGEEYQEELPFRYKPLFLIGPYKMILTYRAPGQETQVFEHTVFALPISVLIGIIVVYILYLMYVRTNLFRLGRTKGNNETE